MTCVSMYIEIFKYDKVNVVIQQQIIKINAREEKKMKKNL